MYGVWCMVYGALCGCGMCALKRAGLCSGEICHAECLERAYGAREGIAGTYGAGDGAGYGGYGAGDSGEI